LWAVLLLLLPLLLLQLLLLLPLLMDQQPQLSSTNPRTGARHTGKRLEFVLRGEHETQLYSLASSQITKDHLSVCA